MITQQYYEQNHPEYIGKTASGAAAYHLHRAGYEIDDSNIDKTFENCRRYMEEDDGK